MSAVLKSEVFQSRSLDHLEWLESESIRILREVVAESVNPALLFSGGMDSIVLLRLAEKAFRPDAFPFPLLHIDTEQNFPEVIAFRDARVAELGERLIVRSVGDSIRSGRIRPRDPNESRNRHQTVTLLDAIQEFGFDVLLGVHVFPLSNWTELDIWRYIARERLAVPSIYTAYDGEWIPRSHSGFAN